MNLMSHREEQRIASTCLVEAVATVDRVRPTPEEFRAIRKGVARDRRAEQRRYRIAAGTDRATLRARRKAGTS